MSKPDDRSAILEFPCYFPLKVVGLANSKFEAHTLTIVRKHVPDLSEAAVATRLSKDGKYQAITITLHATSRAQLDALYCELSTADQVIMVL